MMALRFDAQAVGRQEMFAAVVFVDQKLDACSDSGSSIADGVALRAFSSLGDHWRYSHAESYYC